MVKAIAFVLSLSKDRNGNPLGNEVLEYRPSKLPAQFWGLSSRRLIRLRRNRAQPPPKFTLKLVASLLMEKRERKMKIGSCGICCETCGLYTRRICSGCDKTKEGVEFLKSINANCPMLECAVMNKVDICSRDCERFPCDKFKYWPLSEAWIEMYKRRLSRE
ncbi:MAG: hypothetical protein COX90_01675 [Candidatus Nealsonbacteria bacterium CG_4_10_14_0_2_um_filter_38_17]|uniref:DUF3795 domain-containing protein n=2 Tax=Candidatus Nealsoniibacteriota TaxID=1817911 RepID=A0A2M7UYF3_9BACT|nr:MAG: hypothetical protein COX36_02960 [Candidatus Nealsonbacteria bacterium CG23_combo_of_CG06-09_8_20_14_all_38_19]PIZ88987.1 MAG: hypothetical protein COX90_01675 [Candidatus Nealsonbacteria bacterium CG_4_10_14_0_2_um_filter_38_17]